MSDTRELVAFAHDYFKLLNDCDVGEATRMFHPACSLWLVVDGKIQVTPLADYLEILRKRESPKSRGEPMYGEVVTIDQVSQDMAFLKVLSSVQPRYFSDYLTVLRENGRWRIVSKVYHVLQAR